MTARLRVRAQRPRRTTTPAGGGRGQAPPAPAAERIPLPHRDRLEARFGRPLDRVAVYSGPRVAAALAEHGAAAATHEGRILLADRNAALPVVAHEVAHVLQPQRPGGGPGGVEPADSAAEREAEALAAAERHDHGVTPGTAERHDHGVTPGTTERHDNGVTPTAADRLGAAMTPTALGRHGAAVIPSQGLPRGAVALLRLSPGDQVSIRIEPAVAEPPSTDATATEPTRQAAASGSTRPGPAAGSTRPAPAVGSTGRGPAAAPTTATPAAPVTGEPPAGAELLPAAGAPAATQQAAAQQAGAEQAAAEQAGAEQAMAAETTSAGLLRAYAAAPPTAKARQSATLGADLGRLATGEANAVQTDVPELRARLDGGAEPAAPQAVLAPAARTVDLDTDGTAPAPHPEIPDTPVLPEFRQATDVSAAVNRFSTAEPAVLADQIGESLDTVQTTDPDVPRSAGPPPAVPLGGETDPALLAHAQSTARGETDAARDEATRAVLDGPGPERVQPKSLDEPFAIGELPAAEIAAPTAADATAGPDGPQAYLAMNLPPEVQASFDEQQQAAMQASLTGAVGQAEQASVTRDEAKQQAVTDAETGAERLATQAGGEQADAVTAARGQIQGARQDTLDQQQREVDRVATDAEVRRQADEQQVQTRAADDQRAIDAAYTKAETKIDEKAAEGDREAAEKKAKAERDAQEQSWWDRAVGFIKDAFNALVDAIGAIFDKIRAAVNAILDAVKAVALAIIDAAAAFIKTAIRAFAALLKAAVEGLIGQIFPELAAALTRAIDEAVAVAERAVDQVADGLKAGVNALVEGLRAGLMAVIGAFQSAITIAIAVAEAAVTGDWGALARKVLDAILKLVGVAPEDFYSYVGRAQETWQLIIDDPGGFLGHVLGAVSGGVERFADNFVTHLQAGLIGWLTGAIGGAEIVLPEKFDLFGVLDIARQILGLTWDRLRAKAATLIGEQNVERLGVVYEFISTLVTQGWGALWAKLTEFVATARDVVFDAIKSFLVERVVMAAITKLATLFNPIGAIVQLVLTAWNIYTFLRDQLSRIGAIVVTIVDAIGDIARGKLDGAISAVEGVLARLLPLAIDLLARILGLGNVAEDVRATIERIRAMVDAGVAAVLKRVAAAFTGGGKAGGKAVDKADVDKADADKAGAKGPADAADTVTETFTVAGEQHDLRAVVTGDEVEPEMASGEFSGLIKRINGLIKRLTGLYLDPKAAKYVGPTAAPVLTDKLTTLRDTAQTLVNNLAKAKAPAGAAAKALKKARSAEKKIVLGGFRRLRELVEGLKLPEATVEEVHPGHGPKAGPVDSFGRATSFLVDPLSTASRTKGEPAAGPVPGISILPEYERGHLVAKSLGGPGDASNLVPMSKAANTTSKGIQVGEETLRWVLDLMVSERDQYGPPDNRPYIFSYLVEANYAGRTPAALQLDLETHGITVKAYGPTAAQAGVRLFALAQLANTSKNGPTNADLLAAIPAPATDDALADNVRRRLAFYFLAKSVVQTAKPIQKAILWQLPAIKTLFPVDPNEGRDVEWHR